MSEHRVGIIGFVNTEEVLADTIRQQTPDVIIDGYEVIPNEAFGRAVDNRYKLYGVNEAGEFGFHNLGLLKQIPDLGYAAVNLGPIPAVFITGETLDNEDINYIGPRRNELSFELDKTRIVDIFASNPNVLPPTKVLETADMEQVDTAIDELGGKVVLKFVGEYSKYYQDSETRRVRMLKEFGSKDELAEFISNSVDASGKIVIQKFIDGQQFSMTCLVDGNEGIFSLGENICYKHRLDGEEGPLCDGTGAFSVNNTLPWLLTSEDNAYIQDEMVRPYTEHLNEELDRAPRTFLNLDLIKAYDGRIYLLEVNNREAGGHTMANLLNGLKTPLIDALQATRAGRLRELIPEYKQGASIVVSAYPENFPYPFVSDDARPTITIPKLKPTDDVRVYTGWVDVLSETEDEVIVKAQLSPTMLFANHAPTVSQARENIYRRIGQIVSTGFAYRTDIGLI